MTSKAVPIILAVGGVGIVGLLLWGPVRARMALADLKASCAAMKARLSVLRTQGGSVDEQAKLEADIANCNAALRDAGVEVDELAEHLQFIADVRRQMNQEFTHLRSTDYADMLKRGSTRGTILRLGEELAGRYEVTLGAILATPETVPGAQLAQLQSLLAEVRKDLSESAARRNCYRSKGPGCDRYLGSSEDSSDAKVEAEISRVRGPLRVAEVAIIEAIREQDGEVAAGPVGTAEAGTGSTTRPRT